MSKEPRVNAGADDSDGDFDLSGFQPGGAGPRSDAKAAKPAKPSDSGAPAGPRIRGTFPKGAPRTSNTPVDGSAPRGRPSAAAGEAGPRRSDGPADRPGKFGPKAGPRQGGRDFRNPELPPSRGAGVPRGPRSSSRDADASRGQGGQGPRNESREFRRPERPRSFGPSDRGPGGPGGRGPNKGPYNGPNKGPRDFGPRPGGGPRTGGFEKRQPGEGFKPRAFPPAGPRVIERVAGAGDHKPVHPDIKPALPLKTDKGRWKESRFLLEGAKNIADALAISSGIIQAAYITEAFEDKDLAALLKKNRVQIVKVSAEELKVLSDAESPQPIIAVANFAALRPDWSTARYVTLCDAVQDPGNVGAILRTSLALGMDAVVLGKGCCDAYNPKVVRSSVGALLQLPFEAGEDLQAKMEFLRQKGFSIVATSSHAPITLDQAKLRKKVALIMGNEGAGTGATFLDMADAVVKIPLRKKVESLNVSVAHGILSYQLLHGRA